METIAVEEGEILQLKAFGYDLEDGLIDQNNWHWESNIDGVLGNGKKLWSALSAGEHTISVIATDLDGNKTTDSMVVTVGSSVISSNNRSFWPVIWIGGGLLVILISAIPIYLLRQASSGTQSRRSANKTKPKRKQKTASSQNTPPHVARNAESTQLLNRGRKLIKEKKFKESIPILRQIIQNDAKNADAWFWLGYAMAELNELTKAEFCFKKAAVFKHPKAHQGLNWLAKKQSK